MSFICPLEEEFNCRMQYRLCDMWNLPLGVQAYNTELKECLVHLNWRADVEVESKMQQLALEALRLSGCRLLMNPAEHKHLITGRMNHGHKAQHKLDQSFYINLLVRMTRAYCNHSVCIF